MDVASLRGEDDAWKAHGGGSTASSVLSTLSSFRNDLRSRTRENRDRNTPKKGDEVQQERSLINKKHGHEASSTNVWKVTHRCFRKEGEREIARSVQAGCRPSGHAAPEMSLSQGTEVIRISARESPTRRHVTSRNLGFSPSTTVSLTRYIPPDG